MKAGQPDDGTLYGGSGVNFMVKPTFALSRTFADDNGGQMPMEEACYVKYTSCADILVCHYNESSAGQFHRSQPPEGTGSELPPLMNGYSSLQSASFSRLRA